MLSQLEIHIAAIWRSEAYWMLKSHRVYEEDHMLCNIKNGKTLAGESSWINGRSPHLNAIATMV